jgi:hypothetical protein
VPRTRRNPVKQALRSQFPGVTRRLRAYFCSYLGGTLISPDHTRQEVEARFVLEEQDPTLATCPPSQLRPDLITPAFDGLLVPLDGPPDRHLGRPAQFLEQTPDAALVVADAEFFLDDPSDAGAGPDLAAEAIGLRPVPEELGDQAFLGIRQLGRAARREVGQQRLGAAVSGAPANG